MLSYHGLYTWIHIFVTDIVMQPVMRRKKSIETLELKDLREKSPLRYVLNENRLDSDGHFEARVVKVSAKCYIFSNFIHFEVVFTRKVLCIGTSYSNCWWCQCIVYRP